MHEIAPFAIPAMRDFVPQKLRPWIIIAFVLVFQFSGGCLSGGGQRDGRFHGFDAGGYHDGRVCVDGGNGIDIRHYVPA